MDFEKLYAMQPMLDQLPDSVIEEAREKASGKPFSFLHISKAEIDLPENTNPYDASVYAKSAQNYAAMINNGILKQDEKPCYYIYRAIMGNHVQTGLAVAASVAEYDKNRIAQSC